MDWRAQDAHDREMPQGRPNWRAIVLVVIMALLGATAGRWMR
jgi:hypothetical protein